MTTMNDRSRGNRRLRRPFTHLGLLAAVAISFWCSTGHAHTVQVCWREANGVTTLYAGNYHQPSEGPSPVGAMLIDGFEFPFTGYILPDALPSDVQCVSCPNAPDVVHYQTLTSGFAFDLHSIAVVADPYSAVEYPECDFPDETFGSGTCADADLDGICNDVDVCPGFDDTLDQDGDGVPDGCDLCPLDPYNDVDGDGVCGNQDDCPDVSNPDQIDSDGDGAGDACDPDDDNDGVVDGSDNCQYTPNPDQSDFDGDGIGDACDTDDDGDGVIDAADKCPSTREPAVVDAEGCAIDQLCPCDNLWKNHGSYVQCITHASQNFVDAQLISSDDQEALVAQAGAASCGQNNR